MKKGFTLIELLIVMVIVGILVTVVLPKYNASLERARAMEAVTNLKAASDTINARYVLNGNQYSRNGVVTTGDAIAGNFIKSRYFSEPVWLDGDAAQVQLSVTREGNSYSLRAHNENGELKYLFCDGDAKMCTYAGAELSSASGSQYRIDLGE